MSPMSDVSLLDPGRRVSGHTLCVLHQLSLSAGATCPVFCSHAKPGGSGTLPGTGRKTMNSRRDLTATTATCLLLHPTQQHKALRHHFNACRTLRFAASSKSAAAASVSLTQHSCSITAGLKVNVLQPCVQRKAHNQQGPIGLDFALHHHVCTQTLAKHRGVGVS